MELQGVLTARMEAAQWAMPVAARMALQGIQAARAELRMVQAPRAAVTLAVR